MDFFCDYRTFRNLFSPEKHRNNVKMKMIKRKDGELTTQQIVILIVLIVSFVIILFLLFRLNLGGTTSEEICHNSVVLKGQSSITSGSLNCKTDYLCISGGGKCQSFSASNTMKVQQGNKTQVMKILADEMSACWYEFGEGQINYASSTITGNKACALCSIVNFDTSLKNTNISYENFYNYLRTTKKTDSQTYLQYLYSTSNLTDFNKFYLSGYLNNNIDPSKEYFILTGISKKPVWGFFGSTQIPVTIMEKTTQNYNTIGCDEFLTKA